MGETGCGKTRLVKYLCALQSPPGKEVENMILMKVYFMIFIYDLAYSVLFIKWLLLNCLYPLEGN